MTRRNGLFAVPLLLASAAHADDVWLHAAGASSVENSRRIAVSRTFDGDAAIGFETGLSHFAVGDSQWTLASLGMNGRPRERLVLDGRLDVGPGRIDAEEFGYHKIRIGATWLVTPQWSLAVSDTYINIDTSVGHVVSAAVTRQFGNRLGITLDGITSAGGNLDTNQIGIKLRWQAPVTVLAGAYAGETRNPIILTETGAAFGESEVRLRQAYAGISLPLGRYTLLTVFDFMKLDSTIRRELSVVVRIPIGKTRGQRR